MNALCRGSASRPRIDHRDSSSQLMTSGAVSNRARTLSGHSEVVDVSVTNEAGLPADPQPVEPGPAAGEAATSSAADTPTTSNCPDHVRALLETAPLVISCEDESLWSIRGPLALPRQSAFIELLVYLGAARLQAPEPLDPWPGVAADTLLDEVWTPRARGVQTSSNKVSTATPGHGSRGSGACRRAAPR